MVDGLQVTSAAELLSPVAPVVSSPGLPVSIPVSIPVSDPVSVPVSDPVSDVIAVERAVAAVVAGDADAFATVVAQFQRPIRSYVVARCPPGGDADEIAQTVFVDAFRRLGDYELGTDLKAWLFAIARFKLMGEATRLRRQADYHSRYVPHALGRELDRRLAESPAAESSRMRQLQACLERLDDAARRLLDLRYADALSLDAIAAQTGRTADGVKKRLYVLRRRLHACIDRRLAGEAAR